MAGTATQPSTGYDTEAIERAIYTEGIIGLRGAFDPAWVDELREDVETAFAEARARPDGAVGRGPNRWYVEIHPEQLRGFADLAAHPWVDAVSRTVLGPDYRIVEVGFDIPGAGAQHQPWHRDFPMPEVTRSERRLDSLAFNVTCVDVTEDMGPFEIAPGTQWDDGSDFEHGMFPPKSVWPRYAELAQQKLPSRGDISARSALTIHRGTANRSQLTRPVLVLGVDGPGGINGERHDLALTRGYRDTLPQGLLEHLHCPVVDTLTPITQKHTIEGLVMGAAD